MPPGLLQLPEPGVWFLDAFCIALNISLIISDRLFTPVMAYCCWLDASYPLLLSILATACFILRSTSLISLFTMLLICGTFLLNSYRLSSIVLAFCCNSFCFLASSAYDELFMPPCAELCFIRSSWAKESCTRLLSMALNVVWLASSCWLCIDCCMALMLSLIFCMPWAAFC